MKSITPRRYLLFALLAPLFTLTALADDPVEVNGIYYTLVPKGKIATVTQNPNGYSGSIVIPSSITVTSSGTTYSVVGIEDSAFGGSDVTSVIFPNSVTSIPEGCFSNCYSLISVTIPNTVNEIGHYAFGCCVKLPCITIPNSVVSIGSSCFQDCRSLSSISIPNSITSIPDACFLGCSNLTSVTIPNSVTSIGANVFRDCINIASISIPNSVTSIWNGAFSNCSSLVSITIPNSVSSILNNTFENCSSLISVSIPESVTYIGESAFEHCCSLTSITLPKSVNSIGSYAFSHCDNLVTVDISNCSIGYNNAFFIGDYAFFECSGLTSIVFPESFSVIGSAAFQGCVRLTSIVLPNIGGIGPSAFYGCTSLRSVKIDGSYKYDNGDVYFIFNHNGESYYFFINGNAFANCVNLEDFSIESKCEEWYSDSETGDYYLIGVYENNPPVSLNIYEGSYVEYASLHVPESEINLYANVEPWKSFGTINALGNESKYYKFYINVNDKGKVIYGTGDAALNVINNQIIEVKEQEDIVLTLTAYEGYKLGAVTVNGVDKTAAVTSDGVLTITDVNDNQTVSVEFVLDGNSVTVTLGELGAATFCCEEALDFSGTEDVKAYIVSAFHPATGKVTLTRITDVPAGTGIVLLGNAGTYDIPLGTGETYVVNMLVGVTADKVLNKTEGANSNFILANGENGVGFYAVKDGSTLAAGKAYLSLPTAVLPSSAQSIGFRFDDATNIASPQPSPEGKGDWYDLNGRRVNGAPTAPGLYIKDGRKVIVK